HRYRALAARRSQGEGREADEAGSRCPKTPARIWPAPYQQRYADSPSLSSAADVGKRSRTRPAIIEPGPARESHRASTILRKTTDPATRSAPVMNAQRPTRTTKISAAEPRRSTTIPRRRLAAPRTRERRRLMGGSREAPRIDMAPSTRA